MMKFRRYGVEKEPDTVKLAKMNLLLNNVRGSVVEANSFYAAPIICIRIIRERKSLACYGEFRFGRRKQRVRDRPSAPQIQRRANQKFGYYFNDITSELKDYLDGSRVLRLRITIFA